MNLENLKQRMEVFSQEKEILVDNLFTYFKKELANIDLNEIESKKNIIIYSPEITITLDDFYTETELRRTACNELDDIIHPLRELINGRPIKSSNDNGCIDTKSSGPSKEISVIVEPTPELLETIPYIPIGTTFNVRLMLIAKINNIEVEF